MKTKLIACITACLFTGLTSQAQILRGGVNFANISITDDGEVDENKMLTSFQVGLSGDVKLTSCLYFQPGIYFTGKGSKTESGQPSDANYYRATSNPYYIEVPLNLVLKSSPGTVRFFGGLGPYAAIGIAGNNEVTGKFLGTSFYHK